MEALTPSMMSKWFPDQCVWGVLGARLFLVLALVGCQPESDPNERAGHSSESQKILYYFTWSDYVDQRLLTGFTEKTGIQVRVDTFSSNEELLAKVQGGATGYDVVVPSDFMASIMASQGLLAPLDLSRIPNSGWIEPFLRHLPFDPEFTHALPYLWGTVGIGYDSSVISTPPHSWDILWDEAYQGRISLLNDQREVLGMALRVMGRSLNSRDPLQIQEAKQRLMEQKPLVRIYTSETFDHLLVSGDIVLAHAWGGPVARAMRERPSIRYVIPQEGGTIWADCLAILKSSPRQDLAMAFIDYLLEADVAVETSNRLLFASANRLVKDRVDRAVRENPAVYPAPEEIERMEWMEDVGPAIRYYDRAWTELKVH